MESPFKTPSKIHTSQILTSSDTSSPFTPKRSLIKKKEKREFNSVSRILAFDDVNGNLPFNGQLELLPLSQQLMLSEYESNSFEQTTPVKTQPLCYEKNTKIVLSPCIKNRPNRFNMTVQEITTFKPSPSKRSNSNNSTPSKRSNSNSSTPSKRSNSNNSTPSKKSNSNSSTPSKRLKSNIIEHCKPITHYFKPIQKRPDYNIINEVSDNSQLTKYKLNEENSNSKIITELFTNNIVRYKPEIYNQTQLSKKINQNLSLKIKPRKQNIEGQVTLNKCENNICIQSSKQINENSSLQNEKKKSPRKQTVNNSFCNTKSKSQLNIGEQVTPSKNESINNSHIVMRSSITDFLEVNISGGDTYSRFIKYLVLKTEMICLGKGNIIKQVQYSTDDELKIYGRLISRKHGWIRSNGPNGYRKYKDLNMCANFDSVIISLATKQLINTDVTSCELDCLLNILKTPELKQLQKIFNINLNSNISNTKPEMIKSFIKLTKNQTTFCGSSVSNLKQRAKKILGDCLKLSDNARDDIISCLIYESYPYFSGEEKDRFSDCFTKFSLVEKKELKFPTFKANPVSINFSSKDSLEMYKIALNIRQEIQLSLEQKDHENANTLLKILFEKLKSAVCNKCMVDSLLELPSYMQKYSAISVYAHTLFKNITILKKSTEKDLAKEVLEFLLKHKQFSMSKQADLHIELAKVFECQYKQLNEAAKVILDGLKDDTISELDRQMLSKRAIMYANRKIRKLDSDLKKELLSVTIDTEKPLPSITISGKIISVREKTSSGRKQVYCKNTENGDLHYMSVEELALSHYKSCGFVNGIHDEGQLIKSMFLLCFWDIIYDSYPPHVLFISQYQDCPLDWRTRHFYSIREHNIKKRISELKKKNIDQICAMLKTRCDEYNDTQSVINWKLMNVDNLPQCKTLLECVGLNLFLAIGDQILKDGRIYLHGMPDLIVWNAVSQKCIFVEVKGPNDKLSERQYSWLLKLIEFGANVEVCHVVGTGGKNTNSENID